MPSTSPIDGQSLRRVEVLTGAPRRRRWSAAEKAAIVAEKLCAPGAVASTVALCRGLRRNQLYMRWLELRSAAVANAGAAPPDFVPIVSESRAASGRAAIEIDTNTIERAMHPIATKRPLCPLFLKPVETLEAGLPAAPKVRKTGRCSPR